MSYPLVVNDFRLAARIAIETAKKSECLRKCFGNHTSEFCAMRSLTMLSLGQSLVSLSHTYSGANSDRVTYVILLNLKLQEITVHVAYLQELGGLRSLELRTSK